MSTLPAVKTAHRLLKERLASASCALDATAGNGKDTLFLALNTPPEAQIWAFDIQHEALANTARILELNGVRDKVKLICDDHANISRYKICDLDVAMFNLGYRPGGPHQLTTRTETTLAAVENVLVLLRTGGVLSVAAYPGHEEGRREQAALEKFLTGLPQTAFAVACWKMLNQINRPPLLYVIEKIRG
ncbi:MAG: class I SAM-dependent methyltransferase [Negativicutes bacterium]|nr:class I SAM-dependent methyltransferase [Negativicutes bacterium]